MNPVDRNQLAQVIREWATIVVVVSTEVDNTDAEFIFDFCEHLAPDLRIGVRVAGNDLDIGVDLTGKRKAALWAEAMLQYLNRRAYAATLRAGRKLLVKRLVIRFPVVSGWK